MKVFLILFGKIMAPSCRQLIFTSMLYIPYHTLKSYFVIYNVFYSGYILLINWMNFLLSNFLRWSGYDRLRTTAICCCSTVIFAIHL